MEAGDLYVCAEIWINALSIYLHICLHNACTYTITILLTHSHGCVNRYTRKQKSFLTSWWSTITSHMLGFRSQLLGIINAHKIMGARFVSIFKKTTESICCTPLRICICLSTCRIQSVEKCLKIQLHKKNEWLSFIILY